MEFCKGKDSYGKVSSNAFAHQNYGPIQTRAHPNAIERKRMPTHVIVNASKVAITVAFSSFPVSALQNCPFSTKQIKSKAQRHALNGSRNDANDYGKTKINTKMRHTLRAEARLAHIPSTARTRRWSSSTCKRISCPQKEDSGRTTTKVSREEWNGRLRT